VRCACVFDYFAGCLFCFSEVVHSCYWLTCEEYATF
jgi:hypothetical protein